MTFVNTYCNLSSLPVSIRRSRVWNWGNWGRFYEPSSLLSLYHFQGCIREIPSFFASSNSCEGHNAATGEKEGSPSGNGTLMKKGSFHAKPLAHSVLGTSGKGCSLKSENWVFCAFSAGEEDGHITSQLTKEKGQFILFQRYFNAFNRDSSEGF